MEIEELNDFYHLERYRFMRALRSRENNAIYLAEDTHNNCEVVIRVLKITGEKNVSHFEEELTIITNLDHPHILPIIDHEKREIDGVTHFLLVMPYCQEGSLFQWVCDHTGDGKLSPDNVKDFIQQAADALQYIHEQGICHGNVKLSQFLVHHRKGELNGLDLRLSGLGVVASGANFSRTNQSSTETATSPVPGEKSEKVEPVTDQYALAVMTYELITGDSLFEGTISQFKARVSQAQKDRLLSPLLSKDLQRALLDNQSEDRYRTISDTKEAICKALDENGISPANLPRRWVAGAVFWFLMTLILSFIVGSILNAVNMIPAFVVNITNGLGGSLTAIWGFVSGILTTVGTAFFIRTWKSLKKPFLIGAGLSLVTVSLFIVGDLRLFSFTDPYTHQATQIYSDPLVNNSYGYKWNNQPFPNGSCLFEDGAYVVDQLRGNFIQRCNALAPNFNDFVYEVHMRIIKGACGGIIFRANIYTRDYYFFEICFNGNYFFRTYLNGNPTPAASSGVSPFINQGLGQTNIVAAVAHGSTFSIYVNREVLDAHITDTSYSDGHIALFADMGSEVLFSYAKLWKF